MIDKYRSAPGAVEKLLRGEGQSDRLSQDRASSIDPVLQGRINVCETYIIIFSTLGRKVRGEREENVNLRK